MGRMTSELPATVDAVVVGAGPNGLVAANLLADAGWAVLVLEAAEAVGGAVRHDDELHPGFVQDTFSAFYPFAAASPVVDRLDLGSVHNHLLIPGPISAGKTAEAPV